MAKRVRDMDVFGGLAPRTESPEHEDTQSVSVQHIHNEDTQQGYTTHIHNTHTQQWVTAPVKQESRSKRVQIVLTPSLLEDVDAEAERCGVSRNELIHQVLERYLRGEKT